MTKPQHRPDSQQLPASSPHKVDETVTEHLFRTFHQPAVFIEKTAIDPALGFTSKKGTGARGYPDFYLDDTGYIIVVEAKATDHAAAVNEVQHYLAHNTITRPMVGIAVSGQTDDTLEVTYFHRPANSATITAIPKLSGLVPLATLRKKVARYVNGTALTDEELTAVLRELNNTFHKHSTVRDTDRSMFFSGLMIALKDQTFRATYKTIAEPTPEEVASDTTGVLISASNLNAAIVDAIDRQLKGKINNKSKKLDWRDRFSFIKTVDYPLAEYVGIISTIETKIFAPYQNEENQDILGKAYKIFLSRAGKMDNKNIILTPDHIKHLMIALARLGPDDVVLDTCTGTGGFLMEAMEMLTDMANGDENKIRHIRERQLIGFENDVVLFSLACSNMFLHGDGRSTLLFQSSLIDKSNPHDVALRNYIRGLRPTKCVINPPYEYNLPIRFTEQALDYLEPGGALIIIMPEPTLEKHADATQKLLKTAKLDFVIRMPANLFSEQGRIVNTAIFGFTKTPHREDDEVLFYDMSYDGLETAQRRGRIDAKGKWSSIEASVLNAVRNRREILGVSTKRRIYDNDGRLQPAGFEESAQHGSRAKVTDLFDIRKGTLASAKADDSGDTLYPFVTASKEWKQHNEYAHDGEAIVFAVGASGSLGRTHHVNGTFTASNLCLVLTAKPEVANEIDLEFYHYYFQAIKDTLVADLSSGTSKKTINRTRFENYPIHRVPIEKQKQLVETVRARTAQRDQLREELEQAEQDLNTTLNPIIEFAPAEADDE